MTLPFDFDLPEGATPLDPNEIAVMTRAGQTPFSRGRVSTQSSAARERYIAALRESDAPNRDTPITDSFKKKCHEACKIGPRAGQLKLNAVHVFRNVGRSQ